MRFYHNPRVLRYVHMVIGIVAIAILGYFSVTEYKALSAEHINTLAELEQIRQEKTSLLINLRDEQYARENIEADLAKLGGTLGTLEKLSKTDEELLQKYSKVYFLNENYAPAKISSIGSEYVLQKDREYYLHTDVLPYLERLMRDARSEGVDIFVASAFRSFEEQAALKTGYKVTYGSGANRFSADQGYSEHQLGTTLDFTSKKLGANFSAFESDPAYKWLRENAHEYGFTLSYPKGNIFYKFEPWHWRFVGIELATRLKNEGKHFYDLDQREIDTYLVKLFD